jgi:hypothetical protein
VLNCAQKKDYLNICELFEYSLRQQCVLEEWKESGTNAHKQTRLNWSSVDFKWVNALPHNQILKQETRRREEEREKVVVSEFEKHFALCTKGCLSESDSKVSNCS